MALYALLILPSSNRVYADSAVELTQAELLAFDRGLLGGKLTGIGTRQVANVPYVTFEADDISEEDAALLGNLSSVYALFEVVGEMLRPVALSALDRFDDDLITIQKYQGKTNEQFTKLLLNVTLLASAFGGEMLRRRFRVLDPLCGRGTTLNQALMYGYDAAGVDRDQKDFEAYAAFIQTWLKRKRVKHKAELGPVRRERQVVGRRLRIELAADREDYKAKSTQLLDVVNVDTVRAGEFFKDGSFDLVVTDLPYGVQHGSRTAGKGLVRSPEDLLAEAAPVWARLLRPGGAMGISWNTFVAKRELAAGLLADAGLEVVEEEPYGSFRHRVDQAIMRDVIVGRKPL
ncbi:TRM11 family SAM-dependent methyltransferase [Dactylosporangium sp. CA-139066]|uniref:TRM11 family SAM-dependent methyltransferase n=1 Tax=Dactylosporangium sp. CA-139066 TaxID=3239930 RepID=UPI003D94F7DD